MFPFILISFTLTHEGLKESEPHILRSHNHQRLHTKEDLTIKPNKWSYYQTEEGSGHPKLEKLSVPGERLVPEGSAGTSPQQTVRNEGHRPGFYVKLRRPKHRDAMTEPLHVSTYSELLKRF